LYVKFVQFHLFILNNEIFHVQVRYVNDQFLLLVVELYLQEFLEQYLNDEVY
jgi:hypothetical protein